MNFCSQPFQSNATAAFHGLYLNGTRRKPQETPDFDTKEQPGTKESTALWTNQVGPTAVGTVMSKWLNASLSSILHSQTLSWPKSAAAAGGGGGTRSFICVFSVTAVTDEEPAGFEVDPASGRDKQRARADHLCPRSPRGHFEVWLYPPPLSSDKQQQKCGDAQNPKKTPPHL